MKSPSTTIPKYLFITRLSSYLNKLVAKPLGIIPDIFRILEEYGLLDCLDNYLANGTLLSEHEWKTIVKERLARNQSDIWLKGVSEKPELINYEKFVQIYSPETYGKSSSVTLTHSRSFKYS